MDRTELRFRLGSEARKWTGRARAAVAAPRWDRRQLVAHLSEERLSIEWVEARAAMLAGDVGTAHQALASHFAARRSATPLNARDVDAVAEAVRTEFPGSRDHSVQRADAVLQGKYDLLGYEGLDFGRPPAWHLDPVHGRRAPLLYWAAVPYLDPACGDHKVIWELNRHQHWLGLGRAYALAGDRRYYDEFVAQLASWLAANPPLVGINWASMLELAFRCLSWIWALEFFASFAARDDGPAAPSWTLDLLLGLDRQLTHVEQNLSRYFSPNTHLSGEALALYVVGQSMPELRRSGHWASIGRAVLSAEATRQIRSDGGHAELSGHYHRYSTDFYLLALIVARRSGDPAAALFEEAAQQQARFLRNIATDEGERPQTGDDDGGQLFPVCGRPSEDCADTLAIAATALNEPELAVGPAPEEAYWMCGTAARNLTRTAGPRPLRSRALAASGYYVLRTARGDHLLFDAGPHGFLNAGHAHADALAIVLRIGGRPFLIDPGTGTYTMDPAARDRFRSTAMHNTVVLDGRAPSQPAGPFHWRTATAATAPVWRTGNAVDYVEGTHDGFAPRRHTRAILAVEDVGWWILDHLLGTGAADATAYWHLHPSWDVASSDATAVGVRSGSTCLAIASTAPLTALAPGGEPLAFHSPVYGRIEPAPLIRAAANLALPATVATFIPSTPEIAVNLTIEDAAIAQPSGPDWHASAFRVRWTSGTMLLLSAVERSGIAPGPCVSPGRPWGTADAQTDARVALSLVRDDRPAEAILIDGSRLEVRGAEPVVLSGAMPLARRPLMWSLAPSVHEPRAV